MIGLFFASYYFKKDNYHSKTFRTNDGFGYEILLHDKVVIHQENVPGRGRRQSICSEVQAKLLSQLVIDKIKLGKSPALSESDLKDF